VRAAGVAQGHFDSQIAVLSGLRFNVCGNREITVAAFLLQSTASKKSKTQSGSTSASSAAAAGSKGRGSGRVTRRSVANGNSSQPTLASMFAKM